MRSSWVAAAGSFSLVLVLLSGCAGRPAITTSTTTSNPAQGGTLRGVVHGGRQPIAGAHVYLYAINDIGYGYDGFSPIASVSLLNASVLTQLPVGSGGQDGSGNYYRVTDASGNFTITGDYTCPSQYTSFYVYSVGGDPGGGSDNPSATLMAPVEACNSSDYVVVNEVSTIAMAYAFAGCILDPTHMSSSGSALAQTGLYNAGQTLKNLYTRSTGVANPTTAGGNGTVPQAEINTLGNILASCVNSTTGSCDPVLIATAENLGCYGDTASIAVCIAHNPGIFGSGMIALQQGAAAPFQPDLSTGPNDWTIAINYTGGGLNIPGNLAIDASGNVWVAGSGGLSEFGPAGVPSSGSPYNGIAGISNVQSLAIDAAGDVWASNSGGSVSELDASGAAKSGNNGYTAGGLTGPKGIAFDAFGNVWVANGSNNLVELNSSGGAMPGSPFSGGGLDYPLALAIDPSANIWVVNQNGARISEFNSAGTANASSPFYSSKGSLQSPQDLALDASGNLWIANYSGGISEFNSSGVENANSPFSGGGILHPNTLAIDGSGHVWVANDGGDISELNSPGPYTAASLNEPDGIAIDGSGNVWVTDRGRANLYEFVGAATPVVTPIVANLLAPYASNNSAVNKP